MKQMSSRKGVINLSYIIETNNLTKYYGKSLGIEAVDIQVEEGDIYGFIGPNGAGKSTLIRTLLNFIFPSSGKASVFGLDCVKDTQTIKKDVGYLPSEVNYYDDMKAGEVLAYSGTFYEKDCSKRLKELVDLFELDTEKRVDTLSMGNKKKLGIIQALLHKPKLLILDEPTSGLDPLMQRIFAELLLEENRQGTTIFFSSHVLGEVQKLCNRVGIIKEGRILKVEDMAELHNTQFKKVRASFKNPEAENTLHLEGILHATQENGLHHFLYQGDVDILLQRLATMGIKNLWLEEPALEEVFMHYYEKGGSE